MTLVVDASVVVAALLNADAGGIWARRVLASDRIASSQQLPEEVAKVLRRQELAGELPEATAGIAYAEMLAMSIEVHPFHIVADRIWQLRYTVTVTDGWYVALAEALDAPLATLDLRLARAPGPRCRFVTPSDQ